MKTFKENPCCAYYSLYSGKDYDEDSEDDCGFCYEGQVKWLDMEYDDSFFDERVNQQFFKTVQNRTNFKF